MIFESHAHYEDKKFDADRLELLSTMRENNVGTIINVGSSIETSKASVELANQFRDIYAAVGVHPSDIGCLNEDSFLWLEKQAKEQKKVVAIGEIGLDYYWDKEEKIQEEQRKWFIRQLEMARKRNLPVIIHSRDAAEDTMQILKEYGKDLKCVIHCFSYSKEIAKEYIKMGYYIGIGGVVTFKNAKKLVETVAEIPLERVLVETDCPYMAPEPIRGTRNSSLNISYVIEKIAEIKNLSVKEVEEVTYHNGQVFYFENKNK